MAEPRETAQAWLAEVLFQRCPGCTVDDAAASGMAHVGRAEADYLAAAILAGVEVETEHGVLVYGSHGSWIDPMTSAEAARREVEFAAERGFTAQRTAVDRVVIRLPAQPIGEDQPDA